MELSCGSLQGQHLGPQEARSYKQVLPPRTCGTLRQRRGELARAGAPPMPSMGDFQSLGLGASAGGQARLLRPRRILCSPLEGRKLRRKQLQSAWAGSRFTCRAQASQPEGTAAEGSGGPTGQKDPGAAAPPAASQSESADQAKPAAPEPAAPITPRRRPNRPDSTNENRGPLSWFTNLLPDFKGFAFVIFHLGALVLTSKLLGIDMVFRGLMQQIPSVRFIGPEAAATATAVRQAGSRRALKEADVMTTGSSRASSRSRALGGTILRDESGRLPTRVASNLVVPFSEFLYHVKKDNVQAVIADGDKVTFVVKKVDLIQPGQTASAVLPNVLSLQQLIRNDEKLQEELAKSGGRKGAPFVLQLQLSTVKPSDLALPYSELAAKNVEFGAPHKVPFKFVNNITMALLYAGVLASVISRLTVRSPNRVGGRQKNGKGRGPAVVFEDVAGVDEAKEELEEIVEYLRMPERFTRLGARPPRGVLLVGPPGTGKTMLAKAVAGEADVPFVSCSGSEFVELYVGLGASRVRELFAQAKKEAPSIVFIDEIDSVAKVRDGRARSVGNDEREQTLNQLLTEMDGFDSNTAVIVLAATNRADVLDPALRRPGRFDRIVAVEPPDRRGRMAILEVHLEKQQLPLADDVDVKWIATATVGFTGADLANLVNEAALLAAREEGRHLVAKEHFEKAVERAIAGIEKKRSALGRSEKAVVARHEVGHAILGAAVAKILPGLSVVQKISIIPRSGGALGFAYIPPAPGGEERQLLFVDEMRGQLATMLGGRAAEEVAYQGRVSTGAMDDIRRATDLAYKGISEYGLSATMGPVSLSTLHGGADSYFGFPDQGRLAELVQVEVQKVLQEALATARTVVQRNVTLLHGLGSYLEEEESVEGEVLKEWLDKVDSTEELREFLQRASLLPNPIDLTVPLLPPPKEQSPSA